MAATVNLFSGQQADIESTDLSGFLAGATVTISRDPAQSVHGASSLKCITSGGGHTYEQVEAHVPASEFVAGAVYTFSAYLYSAAGGGTLRFYCQSSSGSIGTVGTITLLAGWNRYSVTVTLPNPITQTYFGLRWDTGSTAQALTLWADCLQCNAGASALPWVPGGNGANPAPTSLYIGGQPADIIAGSLNVQNQIGQRSTGAMSAWTRVGVKWSYGTQVQVYDATGTLVYAGYTVKDHKSKDGAPQGQGFLQHDLTLMDNCYKADKRVIWYTNTNVPAGQIFADLINKVLYQEGVTYTAATVASGPTIPEVIWNGKQISACFDWLAKQAGYWWNIDVNSVAWFQPYGGVPAPFVLDGTQVDAGTLGGLSVEDGNDMYVNTQYTKGGNAEKGTKAAPLDETFHGNGVTRSFTLSYPVSTLYQVKLNGVDVTAASLTKGNSGGQWYYAPADAVIAQDPSQTVLGSGDTLEIKYSGRVPAIGKASNPALIAAQKAREGNGSSGIVESVYADTKVHTLSAALQIAAALLAHYGQDATVLEFDTLETGLLEGQMLTVNLSDFVLNNKQMLITDVGLTDQTDGFNVWFHVKAVGSPYDAAQWQTFFQNLMNQQSDPADLSDTSDQQLTPIVTSTFSHTPSFSTTLDKVICNICNTGTLCGNSVLVC